MKFLVAGIPKSGTMLIWKAIPESQRAKTHLFPDVKFSIEGKKVDPFYKVIFLFGDPILSVISTLRDCNQSKEWMSLHAKHCGCLKSLHEIDIINRDDFNYERMFIEWTTTDKFSVLCLRYESLYSNINLLESFLAREIRLPPWRKRVTTYNDVSPETLERVKSTYGNLAKIIENYPDYKFLNCS